VKNRDFTLSVYEKLLSAITGSGYNVLTVYEYLSQQKHEEPFIILRHDVDRSPGNSLKMAELESAYKINSTYYFRINPRTLIPEIISRIKYHGHEIGYHYEVMDKSKGDIKLAEKIFMDELARLRELADVNTVCMHGNPLSPFDNRSFWKHFSLEQFNLTGEAYLDINNRELFYSTDTGRGWNRRKYNLKDTFSDRTISHLPAYDTTQQLIEAVETRQYKKIYLQIHPNRWNWNSLKWNMQLAEDIAVNVIKLLIVNFRKKRDNI